MLTCKRVNEVRGFFLLGGVRCWYGWPMRLANGNPEKEKKHFQKCHFTSTLQLFKRVEIKNLKYKKEVSNKKWDRPSRSANKFKVLWPLLFNIISLCDSVTLSRDAGVYGFCF
jgi:hypothetical protein